MLDARLEVVDSGGSRRVVAIEKLPFQIGRREGNDLRLNAGEVSRDHAEIVEIEGALVLRDRQSRYGTYVNEGAEKVQEHRLAHGDRIRLGKHGGAELVFSRSAGAPHSDPSATTAIGDLRHVAALLEGLRALGSGRVLDDVLALVLDSAIDVSGAERGFVMLANSATGQLEFKLWRARGRITLPGTQFQTSRKIPEQVFETGETRIVADLYEGNLPDVHMGTVQLGIRHVLCMPLQIVRFVDHAEAAGGEERIGVLYLDSREKGSLLSGSTRTALETLATEAAIAIENARLYRETLEKAKLDREIQIAAAIQRALLPRTSTEGGFFKAVGAAVPCRSIGGDFFDCIHLPDGRFGFALGDVSGKGPPAALLSAMVQGMFAAQSEVSESPAEAISRVNRALIRRAVESKYVTLTYGVLDAQGRLTFCNAGHNPPMVLGQNGLRRLEAAGPPVGLFDLGPYGEGCISLDPGDTVLVFSDGVSEALNTEGEEFGETRLLDALKEFVALDPGNILEGLLRRVKEFAAGAVQNDDVTALVVRYHPPGQRS